MVTLYSFEEIHERRPAYNALVGKVYRLPFGHPQAGRIVAVKRQSSYWLPEGGHGRGFVLDQGWVVQLHARDANDFEKAALAAAEAKARAQRGEVV